MLEGSYPDYIPNGIAERVEMHEGRTLKEKKQQEKYRARFNRRK